MSSGGASAERVVVATCNAQEGSSEVQLSALSMAVLRRSQGFTSGRADGSSEPKVSSKGTQMSKNNSETQALPLAWYGLGPLSSPCRRTLAMLWLPRFSAAPRL